MYAITPAACRKLADSLQSNAGAPKACMVPKKIAQVNRMSRPTPHRFVNALLMGLFFALMAIFAKGFLIGLDQRDAGWGWLAVPIDAISAPVLLIPDLLMLRKGQYEQLVVLPWALGGLAIGGLLGLVRHR
jgi:hypothetical protein